MAALARAGARGGDGLQRRDRRRHEAPGLDRAAARSARAAGRRRSRPDGPGADATRSKLREHGMGSAQVLLTHADLADRERYLNARSTLLTLLGARRGAGHQRERHGRQRRDQVRRQRHAGRAGRQPDRGRRAGHPDRPEGPVLGRSAQGPGRALRRRSRAPATPALEAMAGGAGSQHRPRRHDHQGPGRQARGAAAARPR